MGEHVLGRALGRLRQGPGQELLGHAELQAVERRQELTLAHVNDRSDLVRSCLAEEFRQDLEHLKALGSGLKPFEDRDEILEAHQRSGRAFSLNESSAVCWAWCAGSEAAVLPWGSPPAGCNRSPTPTTSPDSSSPSRSRPASGRSRARPSGLRPYNSTRPLSRQRHPASPERR